MADLKQIKVGSTTYNIEPYTSYYKSGCSNFEMNSSGSLLGYGGFIDFHFFNSSGKPLNSEGTVVSDTPDYTSRIIEDSAGRIAINGTYITWSGLTSSSITSHSSVDANSARISNGLYVGTSITHYEQEDLAIGNSTNGGYVYFVEDVAGGSTPNEGESNWTIGIDGSFSGTDFSGTSFSGGGSGLTNLNASNLSSGTVAYARLPVGTGSSQVAQGSHTHLYAGSSSAGGAATSANKVNKSITFNNGGSGASSGTTFDGSTARTVSYNTIGALKYTATSRDNTDSHANYILGKSTTDSNSDNYYNSYVYFKGYSFYAYNIYSTSDERLKTNIVNSTLNYYDIINKMRFVEYNWKSKESDKNLHHGILAQELMKILPTELRSHFVSDGEYLSVSDNKLVYLALGALQQQLEINKRLEERIAKLEKLLGV